MSEGTFYLDAVHLGITQADRGLFVSIYFVNIFSHSTAKFCPSYSVLHVITVDSHYLEVRGIL